MSAIFQNLYVQMVILAYGVALIIFMLTTPKSVKSWSLRIALGVYIALVVTIRVYNPLTHDLVDPDLFMQAAGSQVYD